MNDPNYPVEVKMCLTKKQADDLGVLAREWGCTVPEMARVAIKDYLKRRRRKGDLA